ncbi:MAG TPA: hypothetical protein VKV06_07040 [Acidimicrobiales bacterium]|nr:hypothetical protein [Acidimicrobiales bacterium]
MVEPRAILLPEGKGAYVEIAKVASSSIKIFLAATFGIPLRDGDPHATEFPTVRLADVPPDSFVFSFVRNPWDRLFLGRFEQLETDFAQVLSRLGLRGQLAYRQASPRPVDFRRFYTPATAAAIARRYAEDVDRFGYRSAGP